MSNEILISVMDSSNSFYYFAYLEDVAEWLSKRHNRLIDIAAELESQITDVSGCVFEIDGVKYFYSQS